MAERKQGKHGYFNVDPILHVPSRKPILDDHNRIISVANGGGAVTNKIVQLPLDGIVLQTIIAKWAGSMSEWKPHLDCARDAGYNMIHFPPLNVRGASNSPYSIADQTDFSHDLFDGNKFGPASSKEQRAQTIKGFMQKLKSEWGILSMSDVVWNHTAHNSPWLNEHPEAGKSSLKILLLTIPDAVSKF